MAVRRGEHEVRDVQNIADILVDPEGSLERRNHWEKTGSFLARRRDPACSLCREPTRPFRVARTISVRSEAIFCRHAARMMTTAHLGPRGVHPIVAQAARELLNKSENERSGVLSTAMSFLVALSRSGYRRSDAPVRLAHRGSGRGWRSPTVALSGRAAIRLVPDQAADPADPQPDRPETDRRPSRT